MKVLLWDPQRNLTGELDLPTPLEARILVPILGPPARYAAGSGETMETPSQGAVFHLLLVKAPQPEPRIEIPGELPLAETFPLYVKERETTPWQSPAQSKPAEDPAAPASPPPPT